MTTVAKRTQSLNFVLADYYTTVANFYFFGFNASYL